MIAIFCTPALALAVGLPTIVPADCNGSGGCTSICDIALLAQNVLNDGIYITVFLSAILFAWAGFKMAVASSSGDEQGVTQAKRIFYYVIIGLVVMLAAWIIVSVVMEVLTNSSTWNSLADC